MSLSARCAAVAACALLAAAAAQAGDFTAKAQVTRVIDGDTIVVRLANGRSEHVRVLGIDTPEVGDVLGRAGDRRDAPARRRQARHARRRRDAGHARPLRPAARLRLAPGRKGPRLPARRGRLREEVRLRPAVQAPERRTSTPRRSRTARASGAAATQASLARRSPSGNCHPSYKGACLDPNASDYDCAGGSGNGPKYTGPVRVVGPDDFGLDRDGDGYACEDS